LLKGPCAQEPRSGAVPKTKWKIKTQMESPS